MLTCNLLDGQVEAQLPIELAAASCAKALVEDCQINYSSLYAFPKVDGIHVYTIFLLTGPQLRIDTNVRVLARE